MGFFDMLFGKKKERVTKNEVFTTPIFDVSKGSDVIIDLKKRNEKITISLKKKHVEAITAEVKLVLDKSGSMDSLYRNGVVQRTVERIIPLAMRFDDDGTMQTVAFSNSLYEAPDLHLGNLKGYVTRYLTSKVGGGTYYESSIRKFIAEAKNGEYKFPAFVIFITDGENFDKLETERALIEASNYDIYFQFIGIGYQKFDFLNKLDNLRGRKFDNAGFIAINDLDRISDEDLYDKLLDEFIDINKNGVLKSAKIKLSKD